MINPKDLKALQAICKRLGDRANRIINPEKRMVMCKQQREWLKLGFRLNQIKGEATCQ